MLALYFVFESFLDESQIKLVGKHIESIHQLCLTNEIFLPISFVLIFVLTKFFPVGKFSVYLFNFALAHLYLHNSSFRSEIYLLSLSISYDFS